MCQNGREIIREEKLHLRNFMYARHKPNVDWKVGEEYPDFSKIRSQQSFNWSAFSLPVWVRFNNNKEYQSGYGVIGYSVNTIKNIHLINKDIPENLFCLHHVPENNNYSHCELYPPNKVSKKDGREFRMMLKHNCQKHILPERKVTWVKILMDFPVMWYHRFLFKFNNN